MNSVETSPRAESPSSAVGEALDRFDDLDAPRDRMAGLWEALLAVSSGLDLDDTLRQVVVVATRLVDARYGALGVLGEDGQIAQFVHVGVDAETSARIGPLPTGHGLLGVALAQEEPLRLADLSCHPSSGGFPAAHPPMKSFLGVSIRARGRSFGRLYLTEKNDGGPFSEGDELVLATLAHAAGIAVENARLYEKTRDRQRWLESAAEVTTALVDSDDATDVLPLIARRALELVGADDAVIARPVIHPGVPPGETAALVVTVSAGADAEEMIGRTLPLVQLATGVVFDGYAPRNLTGVTFDPVPGLPVRFGPTLAVPLRTGESPAGMLLALRHSGAAPFDEHHLEIVSSFSDQAALALQHAESQLARRERDVLVDRDRIARDLHDHVIQRLFAVGLAMQGTQRRSTTPEVAERLSDHIDQLHEVVQEIRTAIFDLHTDTLGGAGLRTRLQGAIAALTDETSSPGVPMRTTVQLSGPLEVVPVGLAAHAEAVVREAVSNVVHHAHADDLWVAVSVDDDLVIDVADNGVGLPDTVQASGLRNLHERAASAGGHCLLSGTADGGTRLRWTAPLR